MGRGRLVNEGGATPLASTAPYAVRRLTGVRVTRLLGLVLEAEAVGEVVVGGAVALGA